MTQENSSSIIILAFAAVVLPTIVIRLLSGKKEQRCMQFPILIAASVYAAAAFVACLLLKNQITALAESIDMDVRAVPTFANVSILFGFAAVKGIMRLATRKGGVSSAAQKFYEYDADSDSWLLKSNWINYSEIANAVSIAVLVVTAGAVAAVRELAFSGETMLYIYPAVVLIVVTEFALFIGGVYDRSKVFSTVSGSDSDHIHIGQYFRLCDILEKMFPAELLSSHSGCEFSAKSGATNLLRELQKSNDRTERIVAAHFYRDLTKKDLSVDSILASCKMMKGKSVIFNNAFYRDLSDYISLPLINALLSNKKCLLITGRNSNCDDALEWIGSMIQEHCRMHSLWTAERLGSKAAACDVGVMSAKEIYDLRILGANREFFGDVQFVILLEPSQILITGQVGLGIIADEIHAGGANPVFCICDRKADGLADTLSHLLHTEMVEVSATPVPHNSYSSMLWDADGDFARQRIFEKQTKFMGGGVELAAVAVRNQIPHVTWFSETRTPVRDLQWLAGQNYATICRYMNQPVQQKSIDDKISFVSGLWSTPSRKKQFIIVDDEFCNMFSTMNMYLSRASSQIFINVLSENYLLRDYMRCNRELFTTDPNAVMSLVPAYSKTERNTVLELILKMTFRPVDEREIRDELLLTGVESKDIFQTFVSLIRRYTPADDSLLTVRSILYSDDYKMSSRNVFSIAPAAFDRFFANTLKNAYFIIEDEVGNTEYINAKQYGHITQALLPGQFIVYDGKYYEVKYISPSSGVILRRASAVYDGRKYYRQLRTYIFGEQPENPTVSTRTVSDIELSFERANFSVETSGYLLLQKNNDLRSAKVVDFSDDPICSNLKRSYKNKNILKIKLPDTTERIRYTVCVLLTELFRSVFPDAWHYLAVLTVRKEEVEGMLNYLLFNVDGDLDENYIYIIEDSELDLGLLEAVERNLNGIFEILTDYLEWHIGKMREPPYLSPDVKEITLPKSEKKELERSKARKGLFASLKQKLAIIFGGKSKSKPEPSPVEDTGDDGGPNRAGKDPDGDVNEPGTETGPGPKAASGDAPETESGETSGDAPETESGETSGDAPETESEETSGDAPETESGETSEGAPEAEDEPEAELTVDDETDDAEGSDTEIFVSFENDGALTEFWDAQFENAGITTSKKSRYQQECYLKFGFEDVDSRFELTEVIAFFRSRGYSNSAIKKARKRNPFDEIPGTTADTVNHCDFCGVPLNGVSYDRLNDGRIRCNDCSATAITDVDEFRQLFKSVTEFMEGVYGISYNIPIKAITADAATIAAARGRLFVPTTSVAARVVGFARQIENQYSIVIENGSPRLATIDTIVHEMTHIWQYLHWNRNKLVEIYGNPEVIDMIYEGMATWASVQFLYVIGEGYYASIQEAEYNIRNDIYGQGFRYYCAKYPLLKETESIRNTPFKKFPPL